jgi:hypothetical protein
VLVETVLAAAESIGPDPPPPRSIAG